MFLHRHYVSHHRFSYESESDVDSPRRRLYEDVARLRGEECIPLVHRKSRSVEIVSGVADGPVHHSPVLEPLGPVGVSREDAVDSVLLPRPIHLRNRFTTDAEVRLIHLSGDGGMVEDDEAEAVVGRRRDAIAEPSGLTRVPPNAVRLSVVGVEEEEVDSTEGDVVVAGDAEEGLEGCGIERTVPVVVADGGEERSGGNPGREELANMCLVGADALRKGIHVIADGDDRGDVVEPHVGGGPGLDPTPIAEVTDDSNPHRGRVRRHRRHPRGRDREEGATERQEGG